MSAAADVVQGTNGRRPEGPLLGQGPFLAPSPAQLSLMISHAGAG